MVNINLYIVDGSYRSDNDTVKVNKQVYEKDGSFEKVEYQIVYGQSFNDWKSTWNIWSSSSYHVYIVPKRDQSYIFKYTVKNNEHVVRKVESYHSKKHPNFPLVIGFKRDKPRDFRYYSFTYLTRKGYYTGFPKEEVYGPSELHDILKEQDKRVNKIKYTSVRSGRSQICKKEDEYTYFPITKLHYSLDPQNRYGLNVLTKEMLLRGEKNKDINTSFITDSYFYDISIYYHRNYNVILLVEFIDDSGTRRQYLRRDADGYYWAEPSGSHAITNISGDLQTRNREIYNNITYMLENNNGQYGGKNITVTPNQLQNEYTLYKHKTSAINSITKTFVLYNRRPITLIDNDKFRGSQRLTSTTIQNSKFKEISTYSRSTSQSEHLLIRLTNDTNTHHYLKRFSQDGIQWRQLSIEEIKEHPFIAASGEEDIKDENLETLLEDSKKTKKLLDWIGVQLKGSLVILLDKKDKEDYADAVIEEAISALEPKKDFNAFKLNNKKITVSEKTLDDGQCISLYSYKVLVYDLDEVTTDISESLDIRFLIPISKEKNKYQELKLFSNSDGTGPRDYLRYQKGQNKVYVVFYQGDGVGGTDHDPRPLLLCYQGQTYRAKTKDDYDAQKWVKVTGVSKCLCNNGGADGGDTDTQNQALLNAVTGVVGFLNQVDLSQHPNGTSSEAESQQCTTGTTSGEGVAAATCQADGTTSCTYEVDKFQGKPIKVQVKCEPFNGSNGPTCYKKLTHQPIGMSGATSNANGFRLGDVEYCDNGDSGSRRTGKIEYYPDGSNGDSNVSTQNKYNPLVKVHAYFYNADTKYSDPLLVVLEFSNGRDTDRECYRLKPGNGDRLVWQKDDAAKSLVGQDQGDDLARHLDAIRYCLKKVVKVELQHNGTSQKTSYPIKGKTPNQLSTNNGFTRINGATDEQITLEVCAKCEKLTGAGFECVQHKLTSISEKTQYQIGGLQLFIPQNLPKQSATPSSAAPDQEILLYNIRSNEDTVKDKISNGKSFAEIVSDLDSYTPIYYTFCMGDVYVYFYVGTKTDESTSGDPRPGLICLNNKAYRPITLPKLKEENYDYSNNLDYTNWVRVTNINKCVCHDQEEDKIIELLTEIYFGSSIMKFLHEHVVELSGGGGGLLCLVGSIVGAILVFKKVTASTAVVAAAATAASL